MNLLQDVEFLTDKLEVKKKKPVKSEERIETDLENKLDAIFEKLGRTNISPARVLSYFRFKDKINLDITALAYIYKNKTVEELFNLDMEIVKSLDSFDKKTILTQVEYEKKNEESKKRKSRKKSKKSEEGEEVEESTRNDVLWNDIVMDILRYVNIIKKGIESDLENKLKEIIIKLGMTDFDPIKILSYFKNKDKINLDIVALAYVYKDKTMEELLNLDRKIVENLESFNKKTILTQEEYEKRNKEYEKRNKEYERTSKESEGRKSRKKSKENDENLTRNDILWNDIVKNIIDYINIIKKE